MSSVTILLSALKVKGIHLVEFLPSFTRETTVVTTYLLLAHQVPSEKGSSLEGKYLLLF